MAKRRARKPIVAVASEEQPRSLPCPFGNKPRKRKCAKRDEIICWLRHRCNNQLHCVGLMKSGRLVFSHHTIQQLREGIALGEFGDEGNKCAQLYKGWVLGTQNEHVPFEFARERGSWNVFDKSGQLESRSSWPRRQGYRMMHKRRLKRRLADYLVCPQPLAPESVERPFAVGVDTCSSLNRQVLRVLRGWGWLNDSTALIEGGQTPAQVTLVAAPSGTLVVVFPSRLCENTSYNGGLARVNSIVKYQLIGDYMAMTVTGQHKCDMSVTAKDLQACELRFVCDMAEAKLFQLMLERHIKVRENEAKAAFAESLTKLTNRLQKSGLQLTIGNYNRDEVTCQLDFRIVKLTMQAAQRIAEHLIRVTRYGTGGYETASEKRQQSQLRCPPPLRDCMGYHELPHDIYARLELKPKEEPNEQTS